MQSVPSRASECSNWRVASFFVRPSIFVIRKTFWRQPSGERLAHAQLAQALVVVPAVVHEVDAALDRLVHQAQGELLVHVGQAEVPAAEPDGGHPLAGAAEGPVRHV